MTPAHCPGPGADDVGPASPVRPAPTPYLEREVLATLIRRYRREKRVSDDLGAALAKIAAGVWDRYRYTADKDDFVQDAVLHLITPRGPLDRVTPNGNPFSFLTQAVRWHGNKLRAAEQRAAGVVRVGYPEELLDAEPLAGGHLHTRFAGEDFDPLDWHPTQTTDEGSEAP